MKFFPWMFFLVFLVLPGDFSDRQNSNDRFESLAKRSSFVNERKENGVVAAQARKDEEKIFMGFIEKEGEIYNVPFLMTIRRDGEILSGEYFYLGVRNLQKLRLSGKISKNGRFFLVETDSKGLRTGRFNGEWKTNEYETVITGQWVDQRKRRKLEFYATQQMIYFKDRSEVMPLMIAERNKKKKYYIQAQYPKISGVENAQAFNELVKKLAEERFFSFKDEMEEIWRENRNDRWWKMSSDSFLSVSYNITYADEDLVSVLFNVDFYYSGAAHPNNVSYSVNFDLKKGKRLSLEELFASSDYLERISESCIEKLIVKGVGFAGGASPEEQDYDNKWLITKKGLLIVFDPYQVDSYAGGTHKVLIPYDELKDILKKDSPVRKIYRY